MEEGKYKTCDKCREYMGANHQKNKEKYNERRRDYYYNHIVEAKEYARNCGRTHREEINERRRNHRAENIEQVNAKIKWMTCPVCDDYEIQCKNYKRHTQTTKHLENLKKQQTLMSFYNFKIIKVKLFFCYDLWYSLFYNLLYCLGCLSFLFCCYDLRYCFL